MNPETPQRCTFASFYDFYDGPEYRKEQLCMYRELASESGGRILELACGTGISTIEVARAGFCVTGLDISSDMLDVAREKLSRGPDEVKSRVRLIQAIYRSAELGREVEVEAPDAPATATESRSTA